MTLDEKFDIVQFERQAKASAMIQTLLDFWESGHEEVPGLTREFVQETIEYAAGVDDGVKDTIVAGYEFYAGGQQQLLESIMGNQNKVSRRGLIGCRTDSVSKQVIRELDDMLYLLPLVKLTFDDFFADGNEDVRYSRSFNFGMPYSIEGILSNYSLNEHRMVNHGTASKLYHRLHKMPEDERKTAIEELLQKIGYTQTFKEYSSSRIYFFSDEIDLAKSVFDDFFADGNEDVRYSRSFNFGMPYSVEAILNTYSLNEHRMVNHGTASKLYHRLHKMPDVERKKAVEELLTGSGYTELFKEYSTSRVYFFSEDITLAKSVFDDFFADGNENARSRRGRNLGTPYSIEAILNTYSLNEHRMVSVGTASKLYKRLHKMPDVEKKKAVEELLTRSGYTELFKEYSTSRVYFFSEDITLAKSVFDDFFADGNENARSRRGGNLGTPYSVEAILSHYSLNVHQMVNQGTASKLYYRLHKMPEDERKTVIDELLQKIGYTQTFKEYSSSRIYFFSDEIDLAKSMFDDFFKDGNEEVRYSHSFNFGMPFSIEAIFCRYSLNEHRMVNQGTANKLYKRLYLMSDAEKTAAITDLLEKTGYTEIFEQYLQSNRNNPFVPPPVEIQQPCTAPRTP